MNKNIITTIAMIVCAYATALAQFENNSALQNNGLLLQKDTLSLSQTAPSYTIWRQNNDDKSYIDSFVGEWYASWDFSYSSTFEDADKGAYYFGGRFVSPSGWGGEWSVGANYGIIDSDYASIFFKLGPSYSVAISEKVLLNTSFCFDAGISSTPTYTEKKWVESIIKPGYFAEVDVKKGGDTVFSWGLSLNPRLIFKVGKVYPQAGLTFVWSKDTKKINTGFVIALGF